MHIRIYSLLCLGAAITLQQVARAELSLPSQALGQIEGTLDFCSELNPKSAAKYKEHGKAIVGKATEKELAQARNSAEYKESYNWIGGELRKAPKEDALKACSSFLEDK